MTNNDKAIDALNNLCLWRRGKQSTHKTMIGVTLTEDAVLDAVEEALTPQSSAVIDTMVMDGENVRKASGEPFRIGDMLCFQTMTVMREDAQQPAPDALTPQSSADLGSVKAFLESFSVNVNQDAYYKDTSISLIEPHSFYSRINTDSTKAWLFLDLEKRRIEALRILDEVIGRE